MRSHARGAVVDAVGGGPAFYHKLWRTIEIGFGVLIIYGVCSEGPRTLIRLWMTGIWDAATSLGPLLHVDGAATAWLLSLALAKIGLATLPSVLWIRSAPRYRWLWLVPLVGLVVILSVPLSLTACASSARWLLLAFMSVAAAALTRVRYLRWTALLPFVVLWEVAASHGLLGLGLAGIESAAGRERLLAECALHDGTRPQNVAADHVMPYYGINSLSDDLVLLSGEGPNDGDMRGHSGGRRVGSWWLRRKDGHFAFERTAAVSGNLWRGCMLDGTTWMARANHIVGTKRLPETGPTYEAVYQLQVPSNDMDFGSTACDPDRGLVYATEVVNGGLWEMRPDGGDMRRYQLGGIWMFPKRRFDGQLVVESTAKLMVFAPAEGRVIERVPAGLGNGGFDICNRDGTVAVADMSGRLRVFQLDGAGHYRFEWGVALFSPRRVAYSRDCSRIAVTSADDHRVFIIDAAARRVMDVFRAGPMLREVAPTGPREFSIADVCSMTTYRW